MIKQLFYTYWKVAVFQETPDNTPYSRFLLGLSALLFVLIMVVQWELSGLELSDEISIVFLIAVSLALSFIVFTYGLLFARGLVSRWVQTATCLYFTHLIVHFMAFPLFILDPLLADANLKNPLLLLVGVVYLFITVGLSIWQFLVTAHIYKHALNTTTVQSVLAAFGLIAVNILTVSFWR